MPFIQDEPNGMHCFGKTLHLSILQAQRAPAYDTLINMIRKDPYFEIDENLGEDTIRLKCRNALNKWIRSMNRALEPAGLGFASLVDPDIEDRKHITLKNLVRIQCRATFFILSKRRIVPGKR